MGGEEREEGELLGWKETKSIKRRDLDEYPRSSTKAKHKQSKQVSKRIDERRCGNFTFDTKDAHMDPSYRQFQHLVPF